MRIAIGADHAGFQLKNELGQWLEQQGHTVLDVGALTYDADDDYPDYAVAVGRAIVGGEAELGVMVCGTGLGSCIALNKLAGIRAIVCSDTFSARHGRLHNDANVLCLGERVVGGGLAQELVQAWLEAAFAGGGRHARRVAKLMALDQAGETR